MAITDKKIGDWTNPIVNEADTPQRSAAEMKAIFDSNSNQIKQKFNGLIDELISESGIEAIGGAIEGLEGNNLKTVLEALKSLIDGLNGLINTQGVGNTFLADDGQYRVPKANAAENGIAIGGRVGDVCVKTGNSDFESGWVTPGNAFYKNVGGGANDVAGGHHAAQHGQGGEDALNPIQIGAANLNHAGQHGSGGSDPITPNDIGAVPQTRKINGQSLETDVTLTPQMIGAVIVNDVAAEVSATWSGSSAPFTQTINVMGVTATNPIQVSVAAGATEEQFAAAAKAKLHCSAQNSGTITLKAFGTKPTVAIPLIVRIFE